MRRPFHSLLESYPTCAALATGFTSAERLHALPLKLLAGGAAGLVEVAADGRARIVSATVLVRLRLAAVEPNSAIEAFVSSGYPGVMSQDVREVDPNQLRLPPSRRSGADPWKLHQQIKKFGASKDEMPPIFVYEDPDGVLEISDGVTRATRIAKLAPGETVQVVVIGSYKRSRANSPSVKDRL